MNQARPAAGSLHHVELYVSGLGASRAFWSWFLERMGYALHQEWDAGFSYRLGPTYLVFVQTAAAHFDPPYHRCRTGLNHLAFHGRSREDVDRLVSELAARGITPLYSDRHPHAGGAGHYAVFFEDPDRIKVEVVAPD